MLHTFVSSRLLSYCHSTLFLTTQTVGLVMTACVLAAAAGTKAALTNPNQSDILGLNTKSNYLQGMSVLLSLIASAAFYSLWLLFFSSTLFLPHFFLFFLASPFSSFLPLTICILLLYPRSLSPFLSSYLPFFLSSFYLPSHCPTTTPIPYKSTPSENQPHHNIYNFWCYFH